MTAKLDKAIGIIRTARKNNKSLFGNGPYARKFEAVEVEVRGELASALSRFDVNSPEPSYASEEVKQAVEMLFDRASTTEQRLSSAADARRIYNLAVSQLGGNTVGERPTTLHSKPRLQDDASNGPTILISHSERDAPVAQLVFTLICEGLSVKASDIFVSSMPGQSIPGSKDWRMHIRSLFKSVRAVIYVATPNSKISEVCSNELGAAWVSELPIQALVVPPSKLGSAALVIDMTQQHLITDQERVSGLFHFLSDAGGIDLNHNASRWTRALNDFNDSLKVAIGGCNFEALISESEKNLRAELEAAKKRETELEIELNNVRRELKNASDLRPSEGMRMVLATTDDGSMKEFEQLRSRAIETMDYMPLSIRAFVLAAFYHLEYRPNWRRIVKDVTWAKRNRIFEQHSAEIQLDWNSDRMVSLEKALKGINTYSAREIPQSLLDSIEERWGWMPGAVHDDHSLETMFGVKLRQFE